MSKIDKVIKYFRDIREESSPSMNTASGSAAGFSGYANSVGPVAGCDNVLSLMKRKKNNKVDKRTIPNNQRKWVKDVEDK